MKLSQVSITPRQLFILDAVGAWLTAGFTGLISALLFDGVGLDPHVLQRMTWYGVGCAVFSTRVAAFTSRPKASPPKAWMFAVIILANSAYAATAIYLLFAIGTLTNWGKIYFGLEALILIFVVILETRVLLRIRRSSLSI
jgi:hypothetical protein